LDVLESALIELNLGNYKKALVLFDQELSANPDNVTALIKKGNILGKFARYVEAISCYDSALSAEPQNLLALINKGLALHYLQKYDLAIECYDLVLQSKPNNSLTIYNKASSMIRANKIPQGLELLSKSIELDFSFKYKARTDADFETIRKTSEFKKLVL